MYVNKTTYVRVESNRDVIEIKSS